MFKVTTAQRENVKLKIGMSGPSGSGKTYSSLQMAYGIAGEWGKIVVVDTENRSATYYSDFGPFRHVEFDPHKIPGGYNPDNWVKLIRFLEKEHSDAEVLVLDSISHEWEGLGGCLQMIDDLNKGFNGWKTVTPKHNAFIDAIRLSPFHVIATMRSKQDYVVEQNEKGKAAPKKVGLKAIQREGLEFDFGIAFDVDINHFAKSSKDRTGLFMPRGEFRITPETGRELLAWATSGVAAPEPPAERYEAKPDQKKTLMAHALKHGFTKQDGELLGKMSEEIQGIEMKHLEAAVVEWRENHGLANAAG